MALFERQNPFSHPDWVFEIKHNGFRSLAYIEDERVRLLSRRGNAYKSFGELGSWMGRHLKVANAVLDGEIVCLDSDGRTQINDLLYMRGDPYFYAFDILWLNGRDLRDLPLTKRKEILRGIVAAPPSRVLYSDHVDEQGKQIFDFACENDLEGVIAKWKYGSYLANSNVTTWIQITNPSYSQVESRPDQHESWRGGLKTATSRIRLLEPELLGIE